MYIFDMFFEVITRFATLAIVFEKQSGYVIS